MNESPIWFSYQTAQNDPIRAVEKERALFRKFCDRIHFGGALEKDHFFVRGSDVNRIALLAQVEPEYRGKVGLLHEDSHYNMHEIPNFWRLLVTAGCALQVAAFLAKIIRPRR